MTTAALFLLGAALIITAADLKASVFGYLSSAISFLAALAAGLAAGRGTAGARLLRGLLLGGTLSAVLLLIGFLIDGEALAASGILSVLSFTVTGTIVGLLLAPAHARQGKRRTPSAAKRNR